MLLILGNIKWDKQFNIYNSAKNNFRENLNWYFIIIIGVGYFMHWCICHFGHECYQHI